MNLTDVMTQLSQPFPACEIDFLPKGAFERDGRFYASALPFADPRVYQDRLNAVCPGEWSSQAQVIVASDKLVAVVTVTVCGVAHTNVGEAPISGENAACEAHAQAFKRACSEFGLGRYLYSLGKNFLPFDKQRKRWDLKPDELKAAAVALYRKAGLQAA